MIKLRNNQRTTFCFLVQTENVDNISRALHEIQLATITQFTHPILLHVNQETSTETQSDELTTVLVQFDVSGNGLNRKIFYDDRKGGYILKAYNIKYIGMAELPTISNHSKYTGLSPAGVDYMNKVNTKLNLTKHIAQLDSLDKHEEVKKEDSLQKRLINKFVAKMEINPFFNYIQYMTELYSTNQFVEYTCVLQQQREYKIVQQGVRLRNVSVLPKKHMIDSVREIIEQYPMTKEEINQKITLLYKCPLIQAWWSCFRVYIMQYSQKIRCVWLKGPSNSGKTYVYEQLKKIFITEEYAREYSRFSKEIKENKFQPQLVGLDEVNFAKVFNPDKISITKALLEGKGIALEQKYMDPVTMFEECRFFISSNALPKIATDFIPGTEQYADLWQPILNRVEIITLNHRFSCSSDKSKYNFVDICYLFAQWFTKFSNAKELPAHIEVMKAFDDCSTMNSKYSSSCIGRHAKYNSKKVVHQTEREIDFGVQTILNLQNFDENEQGGDSEMENEDETDMKNQEQ